MRGQGRVYRLAWKDRATGATRTSPKWRLDYYGPDGKRHREPANTTRRKAALDLLRQRIGDRRAGKLIGSPDRVTLHELRELHERQFELDGRRSKVRAVQCWNHLEEFFGAACRVAELVPTRQDDYAAARLKAGAARQTVNNELSALRRGFRLAVKKGLLAAIPVVELPKVRNTREGFFEDGDFAGVLLELPEYLRGLVRFLRLTGWRLGEGIGLTWNQVDRDGQVLRIGSRATKWGDSRTFPFAHAPELAALLEAQWGARDGVFVFHRQGHRIGNLRGVWLGACRRAGVAGRLVHDLRRTAARDMRRAGISEGEIMRLCGWRTRAMFDRYNIIDEEDLAAAVAKRFMGRVRAESEGTAPTPEGLTSCAVSGRGGRVA